jgi:site-specific recombinase XerD
MDDGSDVLLADVEMQMLLDSWILRLRAARKSQHTIDSYRQGVTKFFRWAGERGIAPRPTERAVAEFVLDLRDEGAASSTVANRFASLQMFSKFLHSVGEVDVDELAGLAKPRIDDVMVDPLSRDEIVAMIQACQPAKGARRTYTQEFTDRRDEAVIRFMAEATARAREVTGMKVATTKILEGTAMLFGKGSRERMVPFSPYTAVAIDNYLRLRRRHKYAASAYLWLGVGRPQWDYPGLYYALRGRAEAAGVEGFHPHRLRHTAADGWLEAGGSEGGLMTVAGWKDHTMLRRYTRRRAAIRAIDEARKLNLGDW